MEENLWRVLEKEGLFHNLLENAYDAIFVVDSEGNFIDMNKAAEELTGYSKSELIGESFLFLHPEKEHEEILSKFEKAPETRMGIMNSMELLRKDKTKKYVDINASFVKHGEENLGIAILRDVSEKRENAEKFEKSFMKNPYSGVIISVPDGKIVDVNEAFEKNSGYSREEAVGKTSVDLNLWKKPEDYELFIGRFKREGCVKEMKFDYLTKDKRKITSLISAEKIGLGGNPHVLAFTKNITKEVEHQEKIKENESKLKVIFENVGECLVYLDKSGRILEVNDKIKDVVGYSRSEVLGKNFGELSIYPGNQEAVKKRFLELVSGEKTKMLGNLLLKDKEGNEVKVKGKSHAVMEDGKIKGLVIIVRKVS